MKRLHILAILFALCLPLAASGREAKLVRYPHYHQGKIVFTYLGEIWTADDNGQNIKRITVHKARDVYPRFSPDGRWIAFSSDRNGNNDVFIVPSSGGTARQLTFHSADDTVQGWSPDGRSVLFASQRGEDFMGRLYLVNVDDGRIRNAGSDMGVYAAFSPDGKKLAINRKSQSYWRKYYRGSYQTDVTVMDIASKKFTDLTDFDGMDSWPMWSQDGNIYFVSDREGSGLTNIWRVRESGGKAEQVTSFKTGDVRWPAMSADGKTIVFEHDYGEPQKITDHDALKFAIVWSPNSKERAFTSSDNRLRKYSFDNKSTAELAASRYGNIGSPVWSPDGKWIAFSKADQTRNTDVYLVPSSGGKERKVTFDSYSDLNPRFSPDGRRLYFVRNDGGGFGGGGQASAQIHYTVLEREDRDPNDPETRPEQPEAGDQEAGPWRAGPPQRNQAPREVNIDWAGLKRRTRQLTRMPNSVFNYVVTPDSRTIVFVTSELAGQRNVPVVYSIQEDGRRSLRIASGQGGGDGEGEGRGRGGFGGFGGGISDLNVTRDGRSLYFREGTAVYSVSLSAGGASAASAAPQSPFGGGGGRRRVSFTAKVKIDKPAEWAQMFDDAWRTMKYRFYDPEMHGKDWDAMRAKYQPLVSFAGDLQELLNIVNEMIGELNASHTGAAPGGGFQVGEARVQTAHLGVELESDEAAGRYRVTHVYEDGPADKDWVKVAAGDYLLAISGRAVKAGDNFWPLLNSDNRPNRKVTVSFNSKPSDDGAWTTRIEPVSGQAYSQLRYERWVKGRGEMVAKLTNGRIGYLHIQAMNQPSLRKFEKEIRENRDKEALIIDQRWNGGGNIEQELLAILVQRQYQVWQPRGTESSGRPFAGFFGPKVVLQNWRSASNAEMFPAGFRALGLGKTIGTPTMGAVIGTGSYSLIDGSTVRTPGVGVYLADPKRTNMENNGVQPDILIENTPEDNLAGRDRQLETAVQELLKQIGQKGAVVKKD